MEKTINRRDFNPDEHVPAAERIKEFRSSIEYAGWRILTHYLGIADGRVGYKATIIDFDGEMTATAHDWRTLTCDDDIQIAETVSVSRALAYQGIMIDKGVATQEEMEGAPIQLPQDTNNEETLKEILQSGRK